MVLDPAYGTGGRIRSQNVGSGSKAPVVGADTRKIIQNVNDRFDGLLAELKKTWGLDAVQIEGVFTVDAGFQGTLTLKDGFRITNKSFPGGQSQEHPILSPLKPVTHEQPPQSSFRNADPEDDDDFWPSDDESSLVQTRPGAKGGYQHLPVDHPLDDDSLDEVNDGSPGPSVAALQAPARQLQELSIQASSATTVDLSSENSVLDFAMKRCYRVGQNAMKQINMDIISHIQPKKQASHAYKKGVVPGWWPEHAEYKEPSHVSKEERTTFFLDIIFIYRKPSVWQHMPEHARSKASSGRTDREYGWTHFLENATQHSKLHNVSAEREVEETARKREALNQIWKVLQYYEEVYHEERDAHIMHMPDQPKNRSGRPPKAKKKQAGAKEQGAASVKAPTEKGRQGASSKRSRISEVDSTKVKDSSSQQNTADARPGSSKRRKSSVASPQELVYVYEQPQHSQVQSRAKMARTSSNKKTIVEHEEEVAEAPESDEVDEKMPSPEHQRLVEHPSQPPETASEDGSVFSLGSPEPENNAGNIVDDIGRAYMDHSPEIGTHTFQPAPSSLATPTQNFTNSAGPSWSGTFPPPNTAMTQYSPDYVDYSRPFQQNDSFTSSAAQQNDQSWPASPLQYGLQNLPDPHFAHFPSAMPDVEPTMVSPIYQYPPQVVPHDVPAQQISTQPPQLHPFYAPSHLPHNPQMHSAPNPAMNFHGNEDWYTDPHNVPGNYDIKYNMG